MTIPINCNKMIPETHSRSDVSDVKDSDPLMSGKIVSPNGHREIHPVSMVLQPPLGIPSSSCENRSEQPTCWKPLIQSLLRSSSIPPLDESLFSEAEATDFHLRSKTYLENRVKEPVCATMFELVHVEIIQSADKKDLCHVSQNPRSVLHLLASHLPSSDKGGPSLFVVNYLVAGSPFISMVCYYTKKQTTTPQFERLWHQFLTGEDAFRNARLKLMPLISTGPWLIKKAVGKRPVIIANALQVTYYTGPSYIEAVIDTSSDLVAHKITALCRSHIKSLVVNLGVMLEAQSVAELPEMLLGTVCVKHVNLAALARRME